MFAWRLRDVRWINALTTPASHKGAETRADFTRADVGPQTVAEIVFTSGTTGEPKGVVLTHRNILANITPVEREVRAFRRYLWPFRPIRFLSLLPLSHMFGQALAMFFPPLVNAATVFMTGYNPDQIIAQVRRHRITLVVTVPRVLEMLRDRVRHLAPACATPDPSEHALPVRLWRYREAHSLFGWRFCGFVLGGAQLDEALEVFWQRLGYAVIQGYGLTETAPMVAWNNPFKVKHGTVGRPLEGIEVRLAADGEILVKGPSVTSGYLNAPEETRSALEGGWFHTGDIGAFDDSGHLVIRGRKKDVIATSEGLKVFPEDVERVLEAVPGVREAAVVGRLVDHAEYVHAVLVLHPNADPATIIREANAKLEPHQRIRDFSVWTRGTLPRTEPMRKLKRFEIRSWVEQGRPERAGEEPAPTDDVERLLSRYAKDRIVRPDTTLDELGLTSLDRIELMMALEEQARVTLSETAVDEARTVGDLRRLTEQAAESWRGARTVLVSLVEPLAVDPTREKRQPTDVDSAAGQRLLPSSGRRTRALGRAVRAAHLRVQPSEPFRYARPPEGASWSVASSDRRRDGEGILRCAFLPRTPHSQGTTDDERHLLSRHVLLQCVPPATEGAWSQADAALHGRARDGWLFDLDLSGRPPHRAR